MGLIFDPNSSKLYQSWCLSGQGRAMEKMVERAVEILLRPQPGERILDVGCGLGNHLLLFDRLGLHSVGVDASPYVLNRARERLGKNADLRPGCAEDLPFEDNEFDLAVLINTLEFLDDPLKALKEAGRVARRGVFMGVMNSLSWHCWCTRLQGLFRESLFDHMRFYNLWELKALAQEAFGSVPVSWICVRNPPPFSGWTPAGDSWSLEHWPFGAFLGLFANMRYWVRTDQHPLRLRLEGARGPAVRGVTMQHLPGGSGNYRDERSLSL